MGVGLPPRQPFFRGVPVSLPRATQVCPANTFCNSSHPHFMAGHSKWSKVKRAKGALDVKRGTIFSKFSKEISVAARIGGGDPAGNPRLRSVIEMARAQSMPSDNIERAIKRGTGEGIDVQRFEEIVYEGYGPGGVAVSVETTSGNKDPTATARPAGAFPTCFTKKDRSPYRERRSTRSVSSNWPSTPERMI